MEMPSIRAAWMTRVPSGTSIGRPSISSLGKKESPLFRGRRGYRGRLDERRRLRDDLDGVHGARLVAHVARHALREVDVVLHVRRDLDRVRGAGLGAARAPDAVLVDGVLDEGGALPRWAAARDVGLVLVAEVLERRQDGVGRR